MSGFSRIVCVDWAKERRRRRAWVADVDRRELAPLADPRPQDGRPVAHRAEAGPTLASVLAEVDRAEGRTLVGIDAALGVPRGYLERARAQVPAWREARGFVEWLIATGAVARFGDASERADAWTCDRPFIAVPAGAGSLRAFWERAGRLFREIDVATRARSPFIVSGIPGTVGSGTRALWAELTSMLAGDRRFALWPFDGALAELGGARAVLAEIYPRVCYGLALADVLPARLVRIAKTQRAQRARYVRALTETAWLRERGVQIRGEGAAVANEDDFDALLSAAGLLRCVLEESPLESGSIDAIEGGILGLASIALGPPRRGKPMAVELECPIEGCAKVFRGSRAGWDAHVGSPRAHPRWHPGITEPARRRARFRKEHASWFR